MCREIDNSALVLTHVLASKLRIAIVNIYIYVQLGNDQRSQGSLTLFIFANLST